MTNEEKAKRLELWAEVDEAGYKRNPGMPHLLENATLLRESAALWRERHPDDALWELEYQRRYKRFDLCIGEGFDGLWRWCATRSGLQAGCGTAPSLPAAKAAAVAWVDAQEGE